MSDLLTVGEAMVAFVPERNGLLRYVNRYEKCVAGAESNVAIGVSRLGHTSEWVSRVGDDEFGNYILRELRSEGVGVAHVCKSDSRPTGIMFKQFFNNSETKVFYYREGSAASRLQPDDIPETLIADARLIHITGITPALSSSCKDTAIYVAQMANKHHIPLSFDPNIRLKLWSPADARACLLELFALADIVEIGLEEGEIIWGCSSPEEIIERLMRLGVTKVAVKLGSKGAVVAESSEIHHIPPYCVEAIDPIGAGDAFAAGFLSGILEGRTLEECGKMGCLTGALAVTAHGDTEGLPMREQLERLLRNESEILR